jgi:hypothetical protein
LITGLPVRRATHQPKGLVIDVIAKGQVLNLNGSNMDARILKL